MLFDFALILLYGETPLTMIFMTTSFLAAPVCVDTGIEQNKQNQGKWWGTLFSQHSSFSFEKLLVCICPKK